ncbi:heavy metal transporter [Streptomyces sp. H10-C2]|uniref:heavy metal transporter n=1 Tax=unclassified Streptomyces TaxID=2593676 RepID=UPI0024BA1131|nr:MULTISPECIES: heavy metal transporter [unclassified Streptomyces]MDJ0343837.1 heavy metal transporter [Streptomyces sp. PH10-H1]MDJ0373426.1 heavy metal transporter [Streptomyces sp. H10-C2]
MPNPSPTSQQRPRRRGRRLRFAVAGLTLLGLAGYGVYYVTGGGAQQAGCTVAAGGGSDGTVLRLEPQQAANASTIAAVATSRSLPERALTIALATSMQESTLRNLDHGDRDSLGLFQQRPSQGWGTPAQIMDPVHSTNEFFDGLLKIDGYATLPLTEAAQRVQRSGFPEAYAKHEADATLLAAALTGRQPGALTCTRGDGGPVTTGDPAQVRKQLAREFGPQVVPRPAEGAAGGGTARARTVQVPSTLTGGAADRNGKRRGWELAQWAVAHSDDLKVEKVSFQDKQWRAADSGKGWQKSDTSAAETADGDVRITVAQ